MKDELVSFEIAKLAKEKGFDELVRDAYYVNTPELSRVMREECWDGYPINSEDEAYLAAPTQSLLQKWLREVHFIHIQPIYHKTTKYSVILNDASENSIGDMFGDYFNIYEEALEKGLLESLKLL